MYNDVVWYYIECIMYRIHWSNVITDDVISLVWVVVVIITIIITTIVFLHVYSGSLYSPLDRNFKGIAQGMVAAHRKSQNAGFQYWIYRWLSFEVKTDDEPPDWESLWIMTGFWWVEWITDYGLIPSRKWFIYPYRCFTLLYGTMFVSKAP